jgi:hypothetical protein
MIISGKTAASPDARTRVLVTFNSHCFSEDYDPRRHTPDLLFRDELGRKRAFVARRYDASLRMRELFEDAWDVRIGWTERKNYVLTLDDGDEPYSVFFTLMASNSRRADVHCLVQSAYFKANLAKHEVVRRFTLADAVDVILERSGHDPIGRAMAKCARPDDTDRHGQPGPAARKHRRRHEPAPRQFEDSHVIG